MSATAQELDFKDVPLSFATYKSQKSGPTISSNLTMSQGGGETICFKVPAGEVVNFSRSKIRGTLYAPESSTEGYYTYLSTQTVPFIRSVRLYGDNQYNLVDLTNADVFLDVVQPCDTKFSDYMTHDAPLGHSTLNEAKATSFQGMAPNHRIFIFATGATSTTVTTVVQPTFHGNFTYPAGLYPAEEDQKVTVTADASAQTHATTTTTISEYPYLRPDNSPCDPENGTDMQYYVNSPVGYDASNLNAADLFLNFDIPLNIFKDTILATDKDWLFPQAMTLEITVNGYEKLGWIGSTATNPTLLADTYDPFVPPILEYLEAHWMVEQNPQIKQKIKDQMAKPGGMDVTIPFTHCFQRSFSASTVQSVPIIFTPSHGHLLKKIYHTVMTGDESKNLAYDHRNNVTDASKALLYTTTLDTIKLQDEISTLNNDDWSFIRDKLKGSVIHNLNMFKYHWVSIDDFGHEGPLHQDQQDYDRNIISGKELHKDTRWEFNGKSLTSGAYRHYTFGVCMRRLNIGLRNYALDVPQSVMPTL